MLKGSLTNFSLFLESMEYHLVESYFFSKFKQFTGRFSASKLHFAHYWSTAGDSVAESAKTSL